MKGKLNKNGKESGGGRPFKMQTWLPALQTILVDEDIRYITDENIVFLVNRTLEPHERISKETFKKWKSGKFAPNEQMCADFLELMEYARIRQKQELGKRMLDDTTGNWTRYAWLLERKFEEFNLKHISENTHKNEETVIQITASSDEQKTLLDNIINADYVDIPPVQLPQKNEVKPTDNTEDDELPF